MNRLFIIPLLFICLCVSSISCAQFDSIISQEQQCLFIRSSVSTGLRLGLEKLQERDFKKSKEHAKSVILLLSKDIIPKLEEKSNMSKEMFAIILDQLDRHLNVLEKEAIKKGVLYIESLTGDIKAKSTSFGERFVKLFKCLLYGALDMFKDYASSPKGVKSLKSEIEKACEECN